MHFEELWEKGENLYKEASVDDSPQNIIDEIIMKLNLYKAIDAREEISQIEKDKIKSRTMGEILLSLTNLSYKDNINVFESLAIAIKHRSIEFYRDKYSE